MTKIEIFQDQINDRENAGNWALSFTDIISPVEPGWLFCLWVRVCVPVCYRKIVFVVTFFTFLSWFPLWLCGCHFFPDWEQYVRMVVSCLVLFKLYILGLYRDWLAKCFLCSDYVNYNEYWPCFCVDLCPVSYFFLYPNRWLCRVTDKVPVYIFISLCSLQLFYSVSFSFSFLSCFLPPCPPSSLSSARLICLNFSLVH